MNLGLQPLANSYHKNERLSKYPLEVMLCKKCFHSQLSVVVNPDKMFKNYLYVSGTTTTFQQHCISIAKDAVSRFDRKKLTVLDIACNDGTLLEIFRSLGCEIIGIDPANNLRIITLKKGIPVYVDYWNKKLAMSMKSKISIITATNVFAHVDDAFEFLESCYLALDKNGIAIIEFPYAERMIENNEFDTVYHEHLSYFLVSSFKKLTDRLGFVISDVIQTPIHGGSIRFILKKTAGNLSAKVRSLIMYEKARGLHNVEKYNEFRKQIYINKEEFKTLTNEIRNNDGKLIGYGASAKGNTMLNYFKVKLDYIVDDNPFKWGYYTPGMNIPIKSPKEIKNESSTLYIAVLSWNFQKEIIRKVRSIRGRNIVDKFLFYVPNSYVL